MLELQIKHIIEVESADADQQSLELQTLSMSENVQLIVYLAQERRLLNIKVSNTKQFKTTIEYV